MYDIKRNRVHYIFEDVDMCRKKILSIGVTVLLTLFVMSGCSMAAGTPSADFAIGVAFSSSVGEKTVIAFLDKNLDLIYRTRSMKYAGAASTSNIAISKGILYCSPEGEMDKSDETTTIAMDISTGKIKEYDNGKKLSGVSSVSVNDKAYYIVTN